MWLHPNKYKGRKYHLKYINEDKNIYLVGIVFNEEAKNIDGFEGERIKWRLYLGFYLC